MEIKGYDKQMLIFLQTLGAKSVSGHHTRRVYLIMEKWCASPVADFPSFSFLVNKGWALYTSTRYTQVIMVILLHLNSLTTGAPVGYNYDLHMAPVP